MCGFWRTWEEGLEEGPAGDKFMASQDGLRDGDVLFSTFVFSGVSNGMPLQRKQGQVPKNPLPPS